MPYMALLIQHRECQKPATPRRGEGVQPVAHTPPERGMKRALWAAVKHDAILAFVKKFI